MSLVTFVHSRSHWRSAGFSESTAVVNNTAGQSSFHGLSMPKTPWLILPLAWFPSNVSWDTNPASSCDLANPHLSLLCMTESDVVWGCETAPMSVYTGVPGQQITSLTPSLPIRTVGHALHEGPQAAATKQEAQSQICWPIQWGHKPAWVSC